MALTEAAPLVGLGPPPGSRLSGPKGSAFSGVISEGLLPAGPVGMISAGLAPAEDEEELV